MLKKNSASWNFPWKFGLFFDYFKQIYNICLVLACETNSLGHLLCLLLKICFYNFNKVSSYRKGLEKNVSYQAVKFFNILRIIRCDLTVLHLWIMCTSIYDYRAKLCPNCTCGTYQYFPPLLPSPRWGGEGNVGPFLYDNWVSNDIIEPLIY